MSTEIQNEPDPLADLKGDLPAPDANGGPAQEQLPLPGGTTVTAVSVPPVMPNEKPKRGRNQAAPAAAPPGAPAAPPPTDPQPQVVPVGARDFPEGSKTAPSFEQFEVWKKGEPGQPDLYLGTYPQPDLSRSGGSFGEFVRQRILPLGTGSGQYFYVMHNVATGRKAATSPVNVWAPAEPKPTTAAATDVNAILDQFAKVTERYETLVREAHRPVAAPATPPPVDVVGEMRRMKELEKEYGQGSGMMMMMMQMQQQSAQQMQALLTRPTGPDPTIAAMLAEIKADLARVKEQAAAAAMAPPPPPPPPPDPTVAGLAIARELREAVASVAPRDQFGMKELIMLMQEERRAAREESRMFLESFKRDAPSVPKSEFRESIDNLKSLMMLQQALGGGSPSGWAVFAEHLGEGMASMMKNTDIGTAIGARIRASLAPPKTATGAPTKKLPPKAASTTTPAPANGANGAHHAEKAAAPAPTETPASAPAEAPPAESQAAPAPAPEQTSSTTTRRGKRKPPQLPPGFDERAQAIEDAQDGDDQGVARVVATVQALQYLFQHDDWKPYIGKILALVAKDEREEGMKFIVAFMVAMVQMKKISEATAQATLAAVDLHWPNIVAQLRASLEGEVGGEGDGSDEEDGDGPQDIDVPDEPDAME